MIRPFPARSIALLLSTTLLVVACGSTTTSPSPSPTAPASVPSATADPAATPSASATPMPSVEADAIYDAIEDQVVALRELDPTDVARETIDGETLKEMNATSFAEDNPAEYVAANDRLLKALGLLTEDQSLETLYLDLIDSQVAGFYRPDEKTLYVVSRSGAINGADKVTFAHEYDHALQDANFPGVFDAQKDLLDQSDQALARAAVYEGDATLLMSYWAIPNLTPAELQDVVAAGSDPGSTAVLARTPQVLVDGLLFPYDSGIQFVAPIQTAGGWAAVDDVYADLPLSTEQVLHPKKYDAGEVPVEVTVDDVVTDLGTSWTEDLQDTFGEFQIGVWLRESGLDDEAAAAASAGWGGDRLTLVSDQDGGWAVVWRTAWDTSTDAREFEAAARQAVADGPNPGTVLVDGDDITVIYASDEATLDAAAVAAGFVFGV
jgi:hypothetical protein